MLKVNEYFDGKVKSIGLKNKEGNSTIGVMEPGVYEFGTSTVEYMTVTSGEMFVKLPGEAEWKIFAKGETFIVEKDKKFQVKMEEQTAYICLYK
jgi:uncharacterized protein YaiE (UPF0345 family)